MKIEEYDNGLEISVKKISFYNRSILRSNLPFIMIFLIAFYFIVIKQSELSSKVIYVALIIIIFSFFLSIIFDLTLYPYYVVKIRIIKHNCIINYYKKTKQYIASFDVQKSVFSKNSRAIYRGTVDVIEIYENNKIILEIWPDFAYIGKQWKQEDIYVLYDILIDYQNKLREK